MRGALGYLLVSATLAATLAAGPAHAAEPHTLPIRFHVAEIAGAPVVDAAFLEAQIGRSNAIFAQYRVQFVPAGRVALAAGHAALETRADRDALGAYATAGAIDCFVVGSLRDVDEPARMRRGVHWHVGSRHGAAHFVILSAIAGPDVLAHELGHYLGNPKHSDTPGNLMSYDRVGDALPFLDEPQLRRMRATIRGYIQRRELALATVQQQR